VSPAMAELAPSVLSSFYNNATPGTDCFVAAPSGVGYAIPGKFPQDHLRSTAGGDPSLSAFANLTNEFMHKADLRLVNYIADTDCSPSCTDPMLALGVADGVILYHGDEYVGGDGKLAWSASGKPVISGRSPAMWGDNTPQVVARHLRSLSKDPRNPEVKLLLACLSHCVVNYRLVLTLTRCGFLLVVPCHQSYSIIPVHVWTHNVSDVVEAAALLGNDFFDVVTPEELFSRVNTNVFHDCDSAPQATGSFSSSCSGGTDDCGVLRDYTCQGDGGPVPQAFFDHTICTGSSVNNCHGRLLCDGDECSCPPQSAQGSFAPSCTKCRDECGLLIGCDCDGLGTTQDVFDYSVCDGQMVANCDGTLVCQGQPCQ